MGLVPNPPANMQCVSQITPSQQLIWNRAAVNRYVESEPITPTGLTELYSFRDQVCSVLQLGRWWDYSKWLPLMQMVMIWMDVCWYCPFLREAPSVVWDCTSGNGTCLILPGESVQSHPKMALPAYLLSVFKSNMENMKLWGQSSFEALFYGWTGHCRTSRHRRCLPLCCYTQECWNDPVDLCTYHYATNKAMHTFEQFIHISSVLVLHALHIYRDALHILVFSLYILITKQN